MDQVEVIMPDETVDSEYPNITWELIHLESLISKNPILGHSFTGFTDRLVTGIFQFQPPGKQLETPMTVKVIHEPVLDDATREINVYQTETANKERWNTIETTTTERLDDESDGHKERTLILLKTIPAYLAVVNQVHTEYCIMDRMGGRLTSPAFPGIEIKVEKGCLVKPVQIGLSVQSVSPDTVLHVLGHTKVKFSPVLTLSPPRRKFHNIIKVCIPIPSQDCNEPRAEAAGFKVSEDNIDNVELVEKKTEKQMKSSSFLNFFLCGIKGSPDNNKKTPEKYDVRKSETRSLSTTDKKALPASVKLVASISSELDQPSWQDITCKASLVQEKEGVAMFETSCTARFCLVNVDPGVKLDLAEITQKVYNHITQAVV